MVFSAVQFYSTEAWRQFSYLNGRTVLGAGTLIAAPLVFTNGTLTSTPALGAMEFDGSALYITLDVAGTPTRSLILAGTSGGDTAATPNTIALRDGSADLYANVFHGIATSSYYADVAERYHSDMVLMAGDVVVFGGANEITMSTTERSNDVFGVVSSKPAVRMNDAAGNDDTHPYIALVGRIPCKVIGPVNKGDKLVTSGVAGVAMAETGALAPYTVFARALQSSNNTSVKLIEVALVGRA